MSTWPRAMDLEATFTGHKGTTVLCYEKRGVGGKRSCEMICTGVKGSKRSEQAFRRLSRSRCGCC